MLLYKCIIDIFQHCFMGFEFSDFFFYVICFSIFISLVYKRSQNKQTKRAQQKILYLNHAGQIMHD